MNNKSLSNESMLTGPLGWVEVEPAKRPGRNEAEETWRETFPRLRPGPWAGLMNSRTVLSAARLGQVCLLVEGSLLEVREGGGGKGQLGWSWVWGIVYPNAKATVAEALTVLLETRLDSDVGCKGRSQTVIRGHQWISVFTHVRQRKLCGTVQLFFLTLCNLLVVRLSSCGCLLNCMSTL